MWGQLFEYHRISFLKFIFLMPISSSSSSSAHLNAVFRFQTPTFLAEELSGNLYSFKGGLRPVRSRIEALSAMSDQLEIELAVLIKQQNDALSVETEKFLYLTDNIESLKFCVYNCRRLLCSWTSYSVLSQFQLIQLFRRRQRILSLLNLTVKMEECIDISLNFSTPNDFFSSPLTSLQDLRFKLEEKLFQQRNAAIIDIFDSDDMVQFDIFQNFVPNNVFVSNTLFEFIIRIENIERILLRLEICKTKIPKLSEFFSLISESCVELFVISIFLSCGKTVLSRFRDLKLIAILDKHRVYLSALSSVIISVDMEQRVNEIVKDVILLKEIKYHLLSQRSELSVWRQNMKILASDHFQGFEQINRDLAKAQISDPDVIINSVWILVGDCLVSDASLGSDLAEVLSHLSTLLAVKLGTVYELLQLVGSDLTLVFEWALSHVSKVPLPVLQVLVTLSDIENVEELQSALSQLEIVATS